MKQITVTIKRAYKPGEIDRNGRCISKEVYNKAINDEYIQKALELKTLQVSSRNFQPFGTISKITDEDVTFCPVNFIANELKKNPNKYRIGLYYFGKLEDNNDGTKTVHDMKIRGFNLYSIQDIMTMSKKEAESISKTLCYLLRHNPEKAHLDMEQHGYVDIDQLISNLFKYMNICITRDELDYIVYTDEKGRYCIKDNKIKCCQGHSLSWVVPELIKVQIPPRYLYHGTTQDAYYNHIRKDGIISKMKRQFVHLSKNLETAAKVAERRKKDYCILEIDTETMIKDGIELFITENEVYHVDSVPVKYIVAVYNFKKKED